jgi:hypothetical protein
MCREPVTFCAAPKNRNFICIYIFPRLETHSKLKDYCTT